VKFSKFRVWDKVPEGSTLIFADIRISLQCRAGEVEGSLHAKTSLIYTAILIEVQLLTERHADG